MTSHIYVSFKRSVKICYFPKLVTFMVFGDSFQPCSLENVSKVYMRWIQVYRGYMYLNTNKEMF